jgi:asparagine synthase (glutamine-hydrolysing)
MCGIVGIWDYENAVDGLLLEAMRNTLSHRGPDDRGIFIDETQNVGLGHQRLTILDLTAAGHQPMRFGDVWVVHNGEIYNFREIRRTLQEKGYQFVSESDTEVILKSFREWGLEAVNRFRGMFAFALWDQREKRLMLVRDRTGIKPLYYYFDGNLFIFASEIRAIIRHPAVKRDIDSDAFSLYLKLGYIPAPLSIFRKISKLEAGCTLTLDSERQMHRSRYWDAFDHFTRQKRENDVGEILIGSPYPGASEEEVLETLEATLVESFRLRLVSDVPVGVFLSSGIDPSTVAALLQKDATTPIKTYSIGFTDQAYNEARDAKRIAEYLGTDHHELYCTSPMAMEIITRIAEIYDEPFGDTSAIPTHLVARFAKEDVKVALSGDGGDEIFGGYRRYASLDRIRRLITRHKWAARLAAKGLNWPPARRLCELKIPNLSIRASKLDEVTKEQRSMSEFFFTSMRFWSEREISALVGRSTRTFDDFLSPFHHMESRFSDFVTFMRAADYRSYLPDTILTKVDRATMAASLEGRDPLLDHKIFEFSARLPSHLIIRNGTSKYLLRKILSKYLPEELMERPKRGFVIPLDDWLKADLRHLVLDYLHEDRIRREALLNWETVRRERENFFSGRTTSAARLWLILEFELWREKWLES